MSSPQKVDRERERSWLGTMEAKVALGIQGIDSNGEAVVDEEYVVGIYRPCGRNESERRFEEEGGIVGRPGNFQFGRIDQCDRDRNDDHGNADREQSSAIRAVGESHNGGK